MRKCTHCNSDVEEDASFCTSCGMKLPKQKRCISCGKAIDGDCEWCVFCGVKQAAEHKKEDAHLKGCVECGRIIDEDSGWRDANQTVEYKEETIKHPQPQASIEQQKEVCESRDLHNYCETQQLVNDEQPPKTEADSPKKSKKPMCIFR